MYRSVKIENQEEMKKGEKKGVGERKREEKQEKGRGQGEEGFQINKNHRAALGNESFFDIHYGMSQEEGEGSLGAHSSIACLLHLLLSPLGFNQLFLSGVIPEPHHT